MIYSSVEIDIDVVKDTSSGFYAKQIETKVVFTHAVFDNVRVRWSRNYLYSCI